MGMACTTPTILWHPFSEVVMFKKAEEPTILTVQFLSGASPGCAQQDKFATYLGWLCMDGAPFLPGSLDIQSIQINNVIFHIFCSTNAADSVTVVLAGKGTIFV